MFLGFLFTVGLIFGSFANVVIWRLPQGESLSVPGSHCPRCDAPIRWYDNIPVVSWIRLRARCRACGSPISARYPAVELTSAALFVLAGVTWGPSAKVVTGAVFFYVLLLLCLIDWDTMRLPDRVVGPLALFGVAAAALAQFTAVEAGPLVGLGVHGILAQPLVAALVGALAGAGLSFLVAEVYERVRGVSGFGGGDVKLLGAMGLFLGPMVLFALFAGSLLGSVYGIIASARSGEGSRMKFPFGPFLAVGGILAATVGPAVWSWYVTIVTGP